MRRTLLIVIIALTAACGRAEADRSAPEAPGSTELPASSGASGASGSSGTVGATGEDAGGSGGSTGGGPSTGSEDAAAGTDDLKVFGFATSDEAALAGQMSVIAGTLAALEADLQALDLDAARADAATLLSQAETLEADAEDAERRQHPLEPQDRELVSARKDGIDAFGLTAEYAAAAAAFADLMLAVSLNELVSVAEDAALLAGTADDLTLAYAELNAELLAWAEANPADAARALAQYGA